MQKVKISLITVCYNAGATLSRCIESVINQNFGNLEYIIIDGGSTDNTLQIIDQYKHHIDIFITGPDKGVYDAMNKGIARATGEYIGMLNADDFFAGTEVLQNIAQMLQETNADALYGNLNYIRPDESILRKWHSGNYRHGLFNFGWMPPHPTFYCRKSCFEKFGGYQLGYGSSADYELMLRFVHRHKVNLVYLDKLLIKMVIGGVSNSSLKNRLKAAFYDLKAMRENKLAFPMLTIFFKPLRKLIQYF